MTQAYKKKLIEVAIPLAQFNDESAKEKTLRQGHPSAMHQWWARRPITSCRAVLMSQLIDDPAEHPDDFTSINEIDAERDRLHDLISEAAKFENNGNDTLLSTIRAEIYKYCKSDQLTILDPFSGSGTTAAEALRLGLNGFATELNPVATVVSKGRTEVLTRFSGNSPVNGQPQKLSDYRGFQGIAEDFEFYAKRLRQAAFINVGEIYSTPQLPDAGDTIAWIWTRTVPSPDPAFSQIEVPLCSSFVLSAKKTSEVIVVPQYNKETDQITYHVNTSPTTDELKNASSGTKSGRGANFICLVSGAAITPEYVKGIGRKRGYGHQMIAIVKTNGRGRQYYSACGDDVRLAQSKIPSWRPETLLSKHPQYMGVSGYGLEKFGDLFTERQLVGCGELFGQLPLVRDEIIKDASQVGWHKGARFSEGGNGAEAYADALIILLTLSLGKLLDLSNAFCPWEPVAQCPRNLFGRQAISMGWTFAEANIFSNSSGSYEKIIEGTKKAILSISYDHKSGEAKIYQEDARNIVGIGKDFVICTDPPYYDAVPYADLSDFFFPWHKKALNDILPGIFSTLSSPKQDELVADRMRHGGVAAADKYFTQGLKDVLEAAKTCQNWEYPITVYYAFTSKDTGEDALSSSGWVSFLDALIQSGLKIVRTWPMRTEMTAGLKAKKNSLATSVLVVCRKRENLQDSVTRIEFIRELKATLPLELALLLKGNIAPVDIAQAAIGPGMEIFSKYAKIIESDDSSMSVKTALSFINSELDEFLNDLHGEFDPETRFAATWFEQNGYLKGEYGTADNLARARGLVIEGVKDSGIIDSSAGKVRILRRDELDIEWDPNSDAHLTIWECCQYLVKEYEDGGETAAAVLVKKMGFDRAESVKDLAYYLYDICSNKRQDAKEATSYNALIAGWSDIMRLAASIHDTDTTRQASLF